MANDDNNVDLYDYDPNKIPAWIMAVVFFLTVCFHVFQLVRHRQWYMIPILIGGIFEVLGYLARVASIDENTNISRFVISTLLILVAPTLFAAGVYMVLGRLIRTLRSEKLSPVRSNWMTKIFLAGDVVSFFTQAAGASMLSSKTSSTQHLGKTIVIIGLAIQLVFFGFFCFCIGIFHTRVRRHPPSDATDVYSAAATQRNPMKLFPALYFASAMILVRSIFRVVEYLWQGGPWQHSELYLYVFDALPMLLMLVAWNVFAPGHFLARKIKKNMPVKATEMGEEGVELVPGYNAPMGGGNWGPTAYAPVSRMDV